MNSLYIHIPFCRKKCDYCDFFSKPLCVPSYSNKSRAFNKVNFLPQVPTEYIDALVNEITFIARYFRITEWNTIYIGGGTPSLIAINDLCKLSEGIQKASPFCKNNFEFTLEMNPQDVSYELLNAIKSAAVTRVSLGIQSLNDKCLCAVGRASNKKINLNALSLLKDFSLVDISVDEIAGLPFQTQKSLLDDLEILCKVANHISLYSLCVEDDTPLMQKIKTKKVPYDVDKANTLWINGRDFLEKNGFSQYEVSNFSKPGYESRHNKIYWSLNTYFGVGSGATGTIFSNFNDLHFSNNDAIRYNVTRDIFSYIKFWNENKSSLHNFCDFPISIEKLPPKTQEFEFLMMNFRTLDGVDSNEYKARFNRRIEDRLNLNDLNSIFNVWKKQGRATIKKTVNGARYALTKKGLLFLNKFLEMV